MTPKEIMLAREYRKKEEEELRRRAEEAEREANKSKIEKAKDRLVAGIKTSDKAVMIGLCFFLIGFLFRFSIEFKGYEVIKFLGPFLVLIFFANAYKKYGLVLFLALISFFVTMYLGIFRTHAISMLALMMYLSVSLGFNFMIIGEIIVIVAVIAQKNNKRKMSEVYNYYNKFK